MKIEEVDKNFVIKSEKNDGLKYYDIPCEPFDLYGLIYDEKNNLFTRILEEDAEKISSGIKSLSPYTAGGRIRFSTNSELISVTVTFEGLTKFSHMPLVGTGAFILYEDCSQTCRLVKSFIPGDSVVISDKISDSGYSITAKTGSDKMKNYILYFPTYNDVKSLKIGLSENAKVGHGLRYEKQKPIVFYGSSITQGACATMSSNSYSALISKWLNVDFINLGFSGSAFGEEAMAKYISDIDSSIFICEYDHNAQTVDFLNKTHYNFYKKFRENNKKTPIIFITKPTADDTSSVTKERYNVIKNTVKKAKKTGDNNVYLLNGAKLFGKKDKEICFVDGSHPNDLGFYRMALIVYKKIKSILK